MTNIRTCSRGLITNTKKINDLLAFKQKARMAKNVKKTLKLKQKVDVIKYKEKHQNSSTRSLAEIFGVAKTQIQCILKRKHEIIEDFENNQPPNKKRKLRVTENEQINVLLLEWFKDVISRRLPVTGPMMQERALMFASELNVDSFKASNGWLESFHR